MAGSDKIYRSSFPVFNWTCVSLFSGAVFGKSTRNSIPANDCHDLTGKFSFLALHAGIK